MSRAVLLVEDDRALRATIETILKAEGYLVETARDGIEALEKLESFEPAVIVLDLMLPRMDGVQFAAELERAGRRPGLPIVVVSADSRARVKARQMQAETLIEKPFSIVELVQAVSLYTTA